MHAFVLGFFLGCLFVCLFFEVERNTKQMLVDISKYVHTYVQTMRI